MQEIILSALQKDALQEVANIGVAHAATALSKMVNKEIDMGIPHVDLIPLEKTIDCVKNEEVVVAVFLKISNELPSYSLLLISKESAFALSDALMGNTPDPSKQTLSEMDESALKEVGNVMMCAFFDSLAELLQITLIPGPPAFAYDMPAAVLDYVLIQIGQVADQVLVFNTDVKTAKDKDFNINIFLVPEPQSIQIILNKLGMN
ncbi:MAG: chemotaxis protein CheC [Euryarchaeota archaeon]|nr:chemotaxis protein CheC [Euryarchaeota archaeon]